MEFGTLRSLIARSSTALLQYLRRNQTRNRHAASTLAQCNRVSAHSVLWHSLPCWSCAAWT